MQLQASQRRTKIVATIGPATSSPEVLRSLIEAGATTLRLNFSHGTHDDHQRSIRLIRQLSFELNQPVGILQDLQGPKIRLGRFEDGSIVLKTGDRYILTSNLMMGNQTMNCVTYEPLADEVPEGATILLDDGRVEMRVEEVKRSAGELHCRVVVGGVLSNNKGVNFPGVYLSIKAITDKDRKDLTFGLDQGVDWVALSFVRNPQDVIKGSVWTLGGYAISQVVRLGNNFLLARLLFPKAFGLMALVYTFLIALQMFSDIGINLSIIQNKRGDDPKFLNTAWTMQVIRGLVLWICACLIAMPAASFYKEPLLQSLLPVVGFTTVIDGLLSTNMATANRQLSLKRLTFLDLGTQLIAMFVTVAGAWIAHTANAPQELAVWALVLGALTSSIIRTTLSHTVMEGIRNRFDWEQEAFNEIFRFGQWIFFSTVLTFFALQGNNLIVPGLLGVGFFGIFTQAQTLSRAANEVIQVLGHRVLFASYSELARDRPERLHPVLRRSRLVLNGINLLACLFFIFLGKPLIHFLYDSRYADAGWMLQILAVGAMVTVLGYTYMDVLMAQGRTYFMTLLLGIQVGIQFMTVFGGYYFGGEFGAIVGIAAVGWFLYPIQAFVFARLHLWQPEVDLPILGIASVMAVLVLTQVV